MTRMVQCIKLGKEAEGLARAPYPGELGQRRFDSVSTAAWMDWLRLQTVLVGGRRLILFFFFAGQYLARQLASSVFGAGADQAAGYVPPQA